jgi:branched-chain amino acid transport system substrate-binding protein
VPRAYYATVGPAAPQYRQRLQDDAEATFSSSQWEPSSTFPGAKQFAQSYSATYHDMPSYQAASAYAAGQILEAAVGKIHSLDREKLRDALSALDTVTILGRYGVDHAGRQIRHFSTTVQWQQGKKEIVAPEDLATKPAVFR